MVCDEGQGHTKNAKMQDEQDLSPSSSSAHFPPRPPGSMFPVTCLGARVYCTIIDIVTPVMSCLDEGCA